MEQADRVHPLNALLQHQLASDESATLNTPYILSALTQESFSPSAHLQKWTSRVNTLMHSKFAGARWAGLCIAHRTALLCKPIMIDCAKSWVGAALPMLTKNEPAPSLKASMRLLLQVFSESVHNHELQRQLANPNVPKFTAALIAFVEKDYDLEVKALALSTMTILIPLYPTVHRPSHAALSALSLRFLTGPAMPNKDLTLLHNISRLFSVLHYTGGKVGSTTIWRKSIDETLERAWNAFFGLRTTFKMNFPVPEMNRSLVQDQAISTARLLDNLSACVVFIIDLLRSPTRRPVQAPLGALVEFAVALIRCTAEDHPIDGHFELETHAMEITSIPHLWKIGCSLVSCLSQRMGRHLTPSLPRLIMILSYHLERNPFPAQRLPFLRALAFLLRHALPLHSPPAITRLLKTILRTLSPLLSQLQSAGNAKAVVAGTKKKGKMRAREFEGAEIFSSGHGILLGSKEEVNCVLAVLDSIPPLLSNPQTDPAMQSLTSRILLTLLLTLDQTPSEFLSGDAHAHAQILPKVREICAEFSIAGPLQKSLSFVMARSELDTAIFDLVLHPRLPPIARRFPPVLSLSLYKAEESDTECHAREQLGLDVLVVNGTDEDRMEVDTGIYRASRSLAQNPTDKGPFRPTSLTAPLASPAPFAPLEALPPSAPSWEPWVESSTGPSAQFPSPIEPAEPLTGSGLVPPVQATTLTTPLRPSAPLISPMLPMTDPVLARSQVDETSTSEQRVVQMRAEDDDEDAIPAINMESDSDEIQSP